MRTLSRSKRRWGIALPAGALLILASSVATAVPPLMTRDDIICRAKSGVGFSYYWGGACWCSSGCSPNFACPAGSCSGSCPGCTHHGTYGADCSGYVTKIWQVPNPISTNTCGHGPYVASTYTGSTSYWSVISRNDIARGDSMASSTHVLLYEQGDPWGSMVAYEARGCSYGIVRNWRTCSSSYVTARRHSLGSACACTPGATESQGCGNCGTQQRSCSSSCQWGSWGACTGQGPCAPGASESRGCCDCGSQSRTCGGACSWGDWSSCQGPDPDEGSVTCATGEPGPCADGRVRCVDGCKACVRTYDPVAEVCDAIDNDCSGEVDDGHPAQMGSPAPAYAATLVDSSAPGALQHDEVGTAWAAFRNDGSSRWRKDEVWLGASYGEEGGSLLYDPESWAAYDVAAVLDSDVEPGGVGVFAWSVRAPGEGETCSQTFRLMDPSGVWLRCPSPDVEVQVRLSARGNETSESSPSGAVDGPAGAEDGGCSCRQGRSPSNDSAVVWWVFGGVTVWAARRRRRGRLVG